MAKTIIDLDVDDVYEEVIDFLIEDFIKSLKKIEKADVQVTQQLNHVYIRIKRR